MIASTACGVYFDWGSRVSEPQTRNPKPPPPDPPPPSFRSRHAVCIGIQTVLDCPKLTQVLGKLGLHTPLNAPLKNPHTKLPQVYAPGAVALPWLPPRSSLTCGASLRSWPENSRTHKGRSEMMVSPGRGTLLPRSSNSP